jgi:hypothetical protein
MKKLSPLALEVFSYLQGRNWTSTFHAMMDLGISAGSFTRRLTEIREAGFEVDRENRHHPNTGRLYRVWRLNIDRTEIPKGVQLSLPLAA